MATSSSAKTVYRLGRFRLDPVQKVLEKEGALVAAPPKAVDLLIALVERAPEVVDKDSLFRVVWPETFVTDSSLTKNICVLRKVLDEPQAADSVIQTASKRGYRYTGSVIVEPAVTTVTTVCDSASEASAQAALRVRFEARTGVVCGLVLLAILLLSYGSIIRADRPLYEADRLSLIARHMWSKADRAEIQKALASFQKAVEVDPRSASAHAGVADAYVLMTTLGIGGPSELVKAREAALRAVELEPENAGARVSLGWVSMVADFDPRAAEREYRRALSIDRNSARALYSYACLLAHAGALEHARGLTRRAQQIDPVSPLIGTLAGRIEYYAGRYQHAIEILTQVLHREPSFTQAHYYMAMVLGKAERTAEARPFLRNARLHPNVLATDEAWLAAVSGDRKPATVLIEERRRQGLPSDLEATALLMPAIDAGETELALDCMEEMLKVRRIELLMIRASPRFDALRQHPRFQSIIQRVWPSEWSPEAPPPYAVAGLSLD